MLKGKQIARLECGAKGRTLARERLRGGALPLRALCSRLAHAGRVEDVGEEPGLEVRVGQTAMARVAANRRLGLPHGLRESARTAAGPGWGLMKTD
jgi:hypothetical protein